MRPFQIFQESIAFFKSHSFEFFDYKDENQFYQNFKKEIEYRFKENIGTFEVKDFKTLFFQYLGFNTSYGLGYNYSTPICKQVWTFSPYVEDEHPNQFLFINNYLERVLGNQIPVSKTHLQTIEYKCVLTFHFNKTKTHLSEENLTLLSHEYIFKVKELINGDSSLGNIYILDFGDEDAVLFSWPDDTINELISFLEIDKDRIQ